MYKKEEDFLAAIAKITIFDSEELQTVCKGKDNAAWSLFEQKSLNFSTLV